MRGQVEEDYRCLATIRAEGIEIKDVLCKVFLPSRVTDPVLLHFLPTEEQKRELEGVWKFSIESTFGSPESHLIKIHATKVYSAGPSEQWWASDLSERLMVAEPVDLTVETFRNLRGEPHYPKHQGTFWLTPSQLLSPGQSIVRSYTGAVEVKTVGQRSFTLNCGMPLSFANHFRYRKNDDGDTVTFTELVAEFEAEPDAPITALLDSALSELDDLLLLASFAERQRCLCVGYNSCEANATLRDYYRRDLVIPQPETNKDRWLNREKWLIDIVDIQDFLNTAYPKLTSFEPAGLIRQAINYTIPQSDGTLQSSFISLYSALETVVLYFRRREGMEFIFDERDEREADSWRAIKGDLKKLIKDHPTLEGDKKRKNLIIKNLSCLKRISFRDAFRACYTSLEVNLDDLWPVVGEEAEWPLSTIRNKLVHGDYLSRPQLKVVVIAWEHLRWTVERLLLALLGWDISKSNVSSDYLSRVKPLFHREWKSERVKLNP